MRIKKSLLILLLIITFSDLFAYQKRDILTNKAKAIQMETCLKPNLGWMDFPAYGDRTFWGNIPKEIAEGYIANAEKFLSYTWPAIKATDYLEFIRSGNRRQEAFGAPKNALLSLLMGELVEGKGRFLDQIINGVWFYCEQGWWGVSAHMYLQKATIGLPDINDHTIDLNVGEMANILSWTWHYFHHEFDKVHPIISSRLKEEIQKKALTPYLERTDFWWMGIEKQSHINNWNPWINFNILNCFLLMEENPERLTEGVIKIIRSLDVFLNSYPDDGGCNEGPSYWGAAGAELFKSLGLLKKISSGKFDVFDNSLVQNMGQYIYKVYIHKPYFINFADADPQTYSNPLLIYQYGKAINDEVMQGFGAYLARNSGWGEKPFAGTPDEQITSLMIREELLSAKATEALVGSFWLPDTEVAGARDQEGSVTGFYFAAKGGFNAESHNHNDVGSCVFYYDGNPVLIDVGRETYTAKTFSNKRYEIWTMQSQYHNLPRINGFDQSPGVQFKAKTTTFTNTASKAIFSTDIAGAYPNEAGIIRWKRICELKKGKSLLITDDYQFKSKPEKETSLNLMTCCQATNISPGVIRIKSENVELYLHYDSRQLNLLIEPIPINDEKLKQYWKDGLSRIVFQLKEPGLKGKIVAEISKLQK